MRQLSLFDDAPSVKRSEAAGVWQIDLFEQGSLGLARASELLRKGDLDGAHATFSALQSKLPHDPTIREQAHCIADIHRQYHALELLPAKNRAVAMLGLSRQVKKSVGAFHDFSNELVRRAAGEWCVAVGDTEQLDGRLPGEWFFSCGAFDEAAASFERAAQQYYDARIAFRWGDVLTARGQTGVARHRYRDGLLFDPYHEAGQEVRDTAVRSLPDVARYEIGIEEEPMAWAAPVGIVTGVLPRRTSLDLESFNATSSPSDAQREALQRARLFTRALTHMARPEVRKDSGKLIEIRRTMKMACPELFQVVLRGWT